MGKNISSVVVALSGGVDSSLAAAILKEERWAVQGVHFLLPSSPAKKEAKKLSVKKTAEYLRVPVSYVDLEEVFSRKVIEPFIDAYLNGLTPNPCVLCNRIIKFEYLFRHANNNGIDRIATGHYVCLRKRDSSLTGLWRGKDKKKEQSYFLHRLKQDQLSRAMFPLCEFSKKETRLLAAEMGLPVSSEPESQEICFIPQNDYRLFLEDRLGSGVMKKGDIINREGEKVGEHSGTCRFTIGQRHGLDIASSRPYYVMELRPDKNLVIVGRKEDLFTRSVEADSFNWIDGQPPDRALKVEAQIRYRHTAAAGRLKVVSPDRVIFEFDEPQWGITPGQALVCYEGEHVLGGGWIR